MSDEKPVKDPEETPDKESEKEETPVEKAQEAKESKVKESSAEKSDKSEEPGEPSEEKAEEEKESDKEEPSEVKVEESKEPEPEEDTGENSGEKAEETKTPEPEEADETETPEEETPKADEPVFNDAKEKSEPEKADESPKTSEPIPAYTPHKKAIDTGKIIFAVVTIILFLGIIIATNYINSSINSSPTTVYNFSKDYNAFSSIDKVPGNLTLVAEVPGLEKGEGAVQYTYENEPSDYAGIGTIKADLNNFTEIKARIRSKEKRTFAIAIFEMEEGSIYVRVFDVEPGKWVDVRAVPSEFELSSGSTDSNNKLDLANLDTKLFVADMSGFTGITGPNTFWVSKIEIERGGTKKKPELKAKPPVKRPPPEFTPIPGEEPKDEQQPDEKTMEEKVPETPADSEEPTEPEQPENKEPENPEETQ